MTVTELIEAANRALGEGCKDRTVEGEVLKATVGNSGHLYFVIAHDEATVRCFSYKKVVAEWPAVPAEGQAVRVRGSAQIYPYKGEFQFVVGGIEILGQEQKAEAA